MAEVIGAVGLIASATQLVQYAHKISVLLREINKRVQDGAQLQVYSDELQLLIETTLEIRQNSKLHSSAVQHRVDACRTEAKRLQTLLEQTAADYTTGSIGRRYFKAAVGSKEGRIAKGFQKLEEEKISLLCCIALSHTEKLASIDERVKEVKELIPNCLYGIKMDNQGNRTWGSNQLESREAVSPNDERANSDSAKQISNRSYLQHDAARVGNPHQQQTVPVWNNPSTSPWDGDGNDSLPQNTPPLGPHAYNEWNGSYNGNPHFPTNGYYYNPPQFRQPLGRPVQVQNCWKGCKVIGADSSASGNQMNGHLGLSKSEEDCHYYEDCTIEGGGNQLNGSANGKDGLEVAASFWSNAKKIESRNRIQEGKDKLLAWRVKKPDEGRNFYN